MNLKDIIRMAREAGYSDSQDWSVLVLFAALVAAAERNKVAAWMIQRGYATGHGDTIEDLLVELEWQVREAEREACAQICDTTPPYPFRPSIEAAHAIRARGQA